MPMPIFGLQEFDEWYTRRVTGFESLAHYYDSASSSHSFGHIAVPTLIISSRDDTFVCPNSFWRMVTGNNKIDADEVGCTRTPAE